MAIQKCLVLLYDYLGPNTKNNDYTDTPKLIHYFLDFTYNYTKHMFYYAYYIYFNFRKKFPTFKCSKKTLMKKYKQCQAQIDDSPLDVIPTLSNEVFLVSCNFFNIDR